MSNTTRHKPYATIIAVIVVAAYYLGGFDERAGVAPTTTASSGPQIPIFDERVDGQMVDGDGVVDRVLPDDNEGSRHQRFILRTSSGQTLLVAHNIDLAPRVDGIAVGDRVRFRGQYEVNNRGGVIHWTHHDPDGSHPGGWLEYRGRRYE